MSSLVFSRGRGCCLAGSPARHTIRTGSHNPSNLKFKILVNVSQSNIMLCTVGDKNIKYAEEIEANYGISIANKRVSITPISIPFDSYKTEDFIEIAKVLDKAAGEIGVDYLAGYSALVQKGFTNGELEMINSIPFALSETKRITASVNVAST